MALATTTDLENLGFDRMRFGKSAADWPGFIAGYLARASRQIKSAVGATVYADAEAPAPTDQDRADDLKLAEAYLACSLLAGAWVGRFAASMGTFQAAHSYISMTKETLKGLEMAGDEMMSRCDGILAQYIALQQTSYVGYTPPEDS